MAEKFTILPGLPPYGPMAVSFPKDGQSAFREGLVVWFDSTGGKWTGNFQRGWTALDKVFLHPDGYHICVVAGGRGYYVDPETRNADEIGIDIAYFKLLPFLDAILVGDGTRFKALGAQGSLWTSPRISWDGIQNISIDGTELTGEAFSPISDKWHPFKLDLLTGRCEDSIYEREISKMVQIVPKRE